MLKDKNKQNPAAMAELFELSCSSSGLAPESKLSRKPKARHGLVPKLSHCSGKNIKKSSFSVYRLTFRLVDCKRIFFMFFPLMRSAFCLQNHWWLGRCAKACFQAQTSEAAMKVTRPQTSTEGFLRFLSFPKSSIDERFMFIYGYSC